MNFLKLHKSCFAIISLLGCFIALPACAKVEKPIQELKSSREFISTDAMQIETRFVVNAIEKIHYDKKSLNSLDTKKFLESYVSDLDPSRLFLKQPQVDEFYSRFTNSMTLYLKQGNIYPAFEIFKSYRTNAGERINWVLDRLQQPFNFNKTDSFSPDRKKRPWPATNDEADQLWEHRIKYELINEILSDTSSDASDKNAEDTSPSTPSFSSDTDPAFLQQLEKAKENATKRYQRFLQNINDLDAAEIQEIFLTAFTHMYDPHSSFFSADSLEDFSISLHNSLVGIGAILAIEDGYCTIQELLPGGPAAESKQLKPKDQILAVSDKKGEMVDIVGLKLRKAVQLIRGKEGTEVKLLIRPADGDPSDRKTITLVRDEIKLTSNLAQAKLFEVPHDNISFPIGVIDIPNFYGAGDPYDETEYSTTRDIAELLGKLKKLGAQGIVLDLRHNGGGLLSEAISLTGLFIPVGPVVHVRDSKGQIREYLDTDPGVAWDGPLIILTSRHSASASEIFAGALKSYNRAIIVGDPSTHGKGTVQVIMDIEPPLFSSFLKKNYRLGATKLTIQKWYLPDGNSTQLKGVSSDIVLPSINVFLPPPVVEADLPYAMEWDSIHVLPWSHAERLRDYTDYIDNTTIDFLSNSSKNRQNTLEEFSFLNETIQRFREKQEQNDFSLNLNARQNQRSEDVLIRKDMEVRLKQLSQTKFKSEKILLDALAAAEQAAPSKSEEKEEEEIPSFDVYTREGLRIMADYLALKQHDQQPSSPSTINENKSLAQLASQAESINE